MEYADANTVGHALFALKYKHPFIKKQKELLLVDD